MSVSSAGVGTVPHSSSVRIALLAVDKPVEIVGRERAVRVAEGGPEGRHHVGPRLAAVDGDEVAGTRREIEAVRRKILAREHLRLRDRTRERREEDRGEKYERRGGRVAHRSVREGNGFYPRARKRVYPRGVAEPPDLVVIEADGTVRVRGSVAADLLRARPGDYRLVADAPGLIVLRSHLENIEAVTRVAMAGELVTRTSVLEVFNIVANAGWRGELHVFDDESHRVLAIDQGAIKYAMSDHPDDRLGQVLYHNGTISRPQLDALIAAMRTGHRIGQLVVEKGILAQEELFAQLQKQIEHIFFSALLTRAGHYVFAIPTDADEPPHHTVHLPVQALLMEGVQRIDEMALFRERIPSDEVCPWAQPKAATMTLDGSARAVLKYADGARTVEDIARETGLGTFKTIKTVYGLLQQGAVVLKPKAKLDDGAVASLVHAFNDVLRDIFMAVATYGGIDQTRTTLEAWISGSGYAPVFGERVDEDGTISAERVVRAMSTVEADNPVEALHHALHELAAFALFRRDHDPAARAGARALARRQPAPQTHPDLMRSLFAIIIASLLLCAGCDPIFALQARSLFPLAGEHRGQRAPSIDGIEVWAIPIEGGRVEALFVPPLEPSEEPGPAVIYAHGNGELADAQLGSLAEYRAMGLAILAVEYRGYGRSAGTPSEAAVIADCVAFYDRLAAREEIDASRIVMHGRSLGGGVVGVLSSERDAAALILESTFTNVADVATRWLAPTAAIRDRFDTREVLMRATTPVLILHGVNDDVIRFRHAIELDRVAWDSRVVAFESGHNDLPRSDAYWDAVRQFLRDKSVLRDEMPSGLEATR